jgi:hypothetical protein
MKSCIWFRWSNNLPPIDNNFGQGNLVAQESWKKKDKRLWDTTIDENSFLLTLKHHYSKYDKMEQALELHLVAWGDFDY